MSEKKFPHGTCDCDKPESNWCCHGTGPAAFSAVRKGKTVLLCTKCNLTDDQPTLKLLVTFADPIDVYLEYDPFGAQCLAQELQSLRHIELKKAGKLAGSKTDSKTNELPN